MKYCNNCILPDTRPNLIINNKGICNACLNHKKKSLIDWRYKENQFNSIIKKTKNSKRSYDCIIPISGGKDSTWQLLTALKYGLKPLCVTWKSPGRNNIGEQNLKNAINLGCDHIDFTVNPLIEKYFTKISFAKYGTTLIPMHMAIHSIPQQLALKLGVPLIILGENSAFEYGGDKKNSSTYLLNSHWLERHGNTNGTFAEHWYDKYLNKNNMFFYNYPSDIVLKKKSIKTIFLGNFFKWDPLKTFKISKKYGFKNDNNPQTGYYNFADIDDNFLISVHHWIKWHKFGITRTWDNLSLEIRNKRISRNEAIKIVKNLGEEKPITQIKRFIKYINIDENQFYKICNKFRNKKIWKDVNNKWIKKNNLI